MVGWLLLIFFVCLHNQLSSIHFSISSYTCLKNVIHQIDSKNDGCSFQQDLRENLGLFLSLHTGKFIFKSTEGTLALCLRDQHVFV